MKKKLIALLLAISACFSMASCDAVKDKLSGLPVVGGLFGKDDSSTDSSSDSTQESAYDLEGAKTLLESRVKTTNAESREEYEVPSSVQLLGVTYTVEWSVDVDSVKIEKEDGKVYVNVYEASLSLEDVTFVLTAKITDPDGNSIESKMNRIVPKLERYVPAKITEKPAENVAYKFNVYQVNNKKEVYINGEMKNTWYFNSVSDYATGIDVYAEHVDGSETDFYLYHLVEAEGGEEVKEYINVVPNGSHVNAVYGNPDTTNFPDYADYEGTLKTPFYFDAEWQTIATVVNGTRYYLGCDGTYDTVEPQKNEGNDYFKGYLVTEFDRLNVAEADKLAHEVTTLTIAPAFIGGGESVSLLSHGDRYPDVKIDWSVNSDAVSIKRNVLSFNTVEAVEDVTLTATLSIGEATETKEISFKVVPNKAADIIDVAKTFKSGEAFGNDVTLTGIVLAIDEAYDPTYDSVSFSMWVNDTKVLGYRMKGEGADVLAPGFTVTCSGKFMLYKSDLEFSFASIESYEIGDETNLPDTGIPADGSTLTIPEILALDLNVYANEKYYVEGVVSKVTNTTYGNVYIKDADGNELLAYGTYDADGNRYDAMTDKPVVGDTVKYYGIVSSYNGVNQLKDAVVTLIEKGEVTPPSDNEGETTPTTPEEILNALYALADGETLEGSFTLTGKITALDSFNNPTIVVEGFEDKPVYCYYLRVENAVNDVITVTATMMKNYGGTYEFMNCTLVSGEVTPPADDPVDNSNAITTPEAGKVYAMSLYQVTLSKTLYLAGGLDDSGKYLATTENASEAVSVYAEAADGGYKFYVLDDSNNKLYIHLEEYQKDNGYYGARTSWQADGTVFTYNGAGCWAAALANDTFFLGTYNDYNTVSASGSYYMTAANMGATQFPLLLIDPADSDDNEGGDVTPPASGEEENPPADDDTTDTNAPAADATLTISDALAYGKTLTQGTSTTDKYYVAGTITSFYNNGTTYGNVYITDADNNTILVFGLYNEDGSIQYNAMDVKPDEGDYIKVYGIINNYYGTPQLKNAWLIEHTPGELESEEIDGEESVLSFDDTTNRTTFTTEQQVWEANGIKVTNDKASSTSNVADYANPARFYKSSSLTIEAANMKTIVIECNTPDYASALVASIAADANVTVKATAKVVTITFSTAVSSFNIATLSAQVRVNAISVYA